MSRLPDDPATAKQMLIALVIAVALLALIGFLSGCAERDVQIATIDSLDAELHVEPRAQFQRDAYRHVGPVKGQVLGFYVPQPGCPIYLPPMRIMFDPRGNGDAEFADEAISKAVAHELLHCARGTWHGASK